jgi:hypothetical protein
MECTIGSAMRVAVSISNSRTGPRVPYSLLIGAARYQGTVLHVFVVRLETLIYGVDGGVPMQWNPYVHGPRRSSRARALQRGIAEPFSLTAHAYATLLNNECPPSASDYRSPLRFVDMNAPPPQPHIMDCLCPQISDGGRGIGDGQSTTV